MQRLVARVGFVLGSLACLAVLGASAAGAGREATPQPKNGGTLVIGLAEDPDALDPTLARTFVGRIVFLHMCEKLYDLNAKLQIVPQLASALPAISKDKLTYTIKIRSGIKFNDGTPLTADAVKESLDRHRTLKGSVRASEISPIDSVAASGRHGRSPSQDAVLAADRPARRPRRDDHVAQATRRPGRQVRHESGLRRRVRRSRTASRATTSRSTSRRTTTTRRRCTEPDRVPHPDRPERARRRTCARVTSRSRPRRSRPTSDAPEGEERDRDQDADDRLPGPHDQHREQERPAEAVRERRHAAREVAVPAHGVRPRARPDDDQQGRVQRAEPARLLSDLTGQPVVRDHEGPGVQPARERRPRAEARQGVRASRRRSR